MLEASRNSGGSVVSVDEWLATIRGEYLTDYVQHGGSAIKFVSGDSQTLGDVARQVRSMAEALSYHCSDLQPGELLADGRKPDFHRMDRFWQGVTEGLDWLDLTRKQAQSFLDRQGVVVPVGCAMDNVDSIASHNHRDRGDLIAEYQKALVTPLLKDSAMGFEFRAAIAALVRSHVVPETVSPTNAEVLLEHLRGRTPPGGSSTLKSLRIYEKINAYNARHYLASLCHWLPRTGRAGLVVVLDFRAYEFKKQSPAYLAQARLETLQKLIERGASQQELLAACRAGAPEFAVSYGDQPYMQMLELLRHFIDDIDRFPQFFLLVLASPSYFDMAMQRNFKDYDALQTRIGLEVHDAARANPAAALVHLGGGK
jgi:hypothetical protein